MIAVSVSWPLESIRPDDPIILGGRTVECQEAFGVFRCHTEAMHGQNVNTVIKGYYMEFRDLADSLQNREDKKLSFSIPCAKQTFLVEG